MRQLLRAKNTAFKRVTRVVRVIGVIGVMRFLG